MDKFRMEEDIVTKIEKGMFRCFGHVERMNEANGLIDKDRPKIIYNDQIKATLKKCQVKSTCNHGECIKAMMRIVEARDVCLDRNKWRDVVSGVVFLMGKKRDVYVMYIITAARER